MLEIIKKTYKQFYNRLSKIVLIIAPLLLYYALLIFLRKNNISNSFSAFVFSYTLYIEILIRGAVDVSLYKYFLRQDSINPFNNFKIYATYLCVNFGLILFKMFSLWLVNKGVISFWGSGYHTVFLVIFLNLFFGVYIVARANMVLPVIILNKDTLLKSLWPLTKDSYKNWLLVCFLIYLPSIVVNYLINASVINMLIITLLSVLIIIFNCVYYKERIAKELE